MKNLFDHTKIGSMKMKNRLIRAAVGDHNTVNGHITEKNFKVYEALAKGGVGTIITGYAYVAGYPNRPDMFGIYDDSFISEYSKLTETVHKYNANIILQLVHCGSYTLIDIAGGKTPGPSAVENLHSKKTPIEMQKQDIQDVQSAFAEASVRAKKAGFDGVEIHAAHGFLLSQFLTPYYNRRIDEYGGTNENRAKMLLETYQITKKTVGKDYPVIVKINCTDGIDDGITPEGFYTACRQLMQANVDAIEVSGEWIPFKNTDAFYFKNYAEKVAAETKSPIILVGGIKDFNAATNVLNETSIEYFSICRPLIAEPDLVNRWASGDTRRVKCASCNSCLNVGKCVLNA